MEVPVPCPESTVSLHVPAFSKRAIPHCLTARIRNKVFILATLTLCVLAGCSVGPDYVRPEVELPERYALALEQPPGADTAALSEYWRHLQDPVLNKLVEVGNLQSLTLQEAALRVEESFAALGVQRAEFFPDIDLVADYQARRRSESVASAITSPNNDLFSTGGTLSWELDLLGRVRRLNESASASLEAQTEEFRGTLVTLHAEIARTYIRYRTFQTELALTEQNIRTQQESLGLAKDLNAAGVAPELDVRQAESNLGQTEAALPLLRIALAETEHRLAVLLGTYPKKVRPLLLAGLQIPKVPEVNTSVLPINILRLRPDIRQAERELAAQHALIGAAEAELYPIVSLPGFFSFESLDSVTKAFDRGSLAFSIGPRIRWNFLDFGRTRGNIKIQDARYRQSVVDAVAEVADALVRLDQLKIREEALSRSVNASKRSAELVRSLYLTGLTDFQNVLDNERRLFEQEILLAESVGARVESFVALFRALGGCWNLQEAFEAVEQNETNSPQPEASDA